MNLKPRKCPFFFLLFKNSRATKNLLGFPFSHMTKNEEEKAKSEIIEGFPLKAYVDGSHRELLTSRWAQGRAARGTGVQPGPPHLPSPVPHPRCLCCSAFRHRSPRPHSGPASPGEPRCSRSKQPGPVPAPVPSSPSRRSL